MSWAIFEGKAGGRLTFGPVLLQRDAQGVGAV